MGKIKITKSELDRIIKEEALKFKKALILKKELVNVEKQLKQLNEVEAGENEAPTGGDNLTAAETQFVKDKFQHKAKFHNPAKNPNTMMEDETEDIEDTDLEVDMEVDTDVDSDTIDKAAVLNAIEDLKMALNLHGASEDETTEDSEKEVNGEEIEDGDEEFEFDSESDDNESEEVGNSEESEEEVEIDEYNELNPSEDPKNPAGEYTVKKENVDEPLENKEEDTLMESEKRRMAVLAGIIKG